MLDMFYITHRHNMLTHFYSLFFILTFSYVGPTESVTKLFLHVSTQWWLGLS